MYRARALQAMETHEDIERLLPVTSWRLWLTAVAGGLLVVAALLYAAADSRTVTVAGDGRVTDGYGVRLVTATTAGQVDRWAADPGDTVSRGQVVAYIRSGSRLVPQRTANAGRVISPLLRPGDPVTVGAWLMEVSATESDGTLALVALDVPDGAQVAPGQPVQVTVTGALGATEGSTVTGTITEVTEPLRAEEVELGLALLDPPQDDQIVAAVALAAPLEPGSAVTAVITVSERNTLQQLLGLS